MREARTNPPAREFVASILLPYGQRYQGLDHHRLGQVGDDGGLAGGVLTCGGQGYCC